MPEKFIVKLEGITKRFPGVLALDNVNIDIEAGSCHGLVGENGAGKSTLGKILGGIYHCDEGRILVDGKAVKFSNPQDALDAGIGVVYQELALCENLTVAENLCLESLPSKGLFLSKRKMEQKARELLSGIEANIDVRKCVGDLPVSQQQLVQIASAVGRGARLIIFDEPTSSLSQHEAEHLFSLIRRLKPKGVTSIYISHRMSELFLLCDTITVLRDGRVIATGPVSKLNEGLLVEMMIGRRLEEYFPKHIHIKRDEELLRVEGLSSPGKFKDVSFSIKSGEILGMAGLVGAGRTEIAEALFGLDPLASGNIYLGGNRVTLNNPAESIKLGMGLVSEDRKRYGIIPTMKAGENMTLPILDRFSNFGFINSGAENMLVGEFFKLMDVRAPSFNTVMASLSGGNQQKIIFARWLAACCRILILDEPTRGVDVGSKAEMHSFIDRLAEEGSAVLLISSELPEVINLSTRILVLRNGSIAAELPRDKADQETIMRFMAGVN